MGCRGFEEIYCRGSLINQNRRPLDGEPGPSVIAEFDGLSRVCTSGHIVRFLVVRCASFSFSTCGLF